MTAQKMSFQAEVSRLLEIVTHSLYSDRSVFLRELIANAADACDKLRYLAVTNPGLLTEKNDFQISIKLNQQQQSIHIIDNGIGMNRDELITNLGTIAHSGTAKFIKEHLEKTDKSSGSSSLIGQFGVGFYSAFMVADRVEVISRKVGDEYSWKWCSEGKGEFTIEKSEDETRGTEVILHLKKDQKQFLEAALVKEVVQKYSDHISIPIFLIDGSAKEERINQATALWIRPKAEITDQQYSELYRHLTHSGSNPWMNLHFKAEGKVDFAALLFIPSERPFDLFHPEQRCHVRLHVKRVFVTDQCPGLLPKWLRFVTGVVDSEDLPLNISRETLQDNPILAKIRQSLIKRILADLQKKTEQNPEEYLVFWKNFGQVLKEGLWEDYDHRPQLLKLLRVASSTQEKTIAISDYIARMKPTQQDIYYLSADSIERAQHSHYLEGFKARGIEVIFMVDPIDEFWIPNIAEIEGKKLISITRSGHDLNKIAPLTQTPEKQPTTNVTDGILTLFKIALKDVVKDVQPSQRLHDTIACLVAEAGDADIRLERLLRQYQQTSQQTKRILEVNLSHPLIQDLSQYLAKGNQADDIQDIAWIIYEQARLSEGDGLSNPADYQKKVYKFLRRVVG
jgi:molecular chaperone HtpG